jgi:hypothetical protein
MVKVGEIGFLSLRIFSNLSKKVLIDLIYDYFKIEGLSKELKEKMIVWWC